MDHSLPGSSVLGIFQARVLECGAIGFSDPKGIEDKNNTNKLSFLGLMGFFSLTFKHQMMIVMMPMVVVMVLMRQLLGMLATKESVGHKLSTRI